MLFLFAVALPILYWPGATSFSSFASPGRNQTYCCSCFAGCIVEERTRHFGRN